MKEEPITFFKVDPQFELDVQSYREHQKMKNPIKYDITKLEQIDEDVSEFRLEVNNNTENSVSKSSLLPKDIQNF